MRAIDADEILYIQAISEFFEPTGKFFARREDIDAMPTIEPERKTGKWVKHPGDWFTPGSDMVWECSECGKGVHVYGIEYGTYGADVSDGQWKACPNCGALMENVDGEISLYCLC